MNDILVITAKQTYPTQQHYFPLAYVLFKKVLTGEKIFVCDKVTDTDIASFYKAYVNYVIELSDGKIVNFYNPNDI